MAGSARLRRWAGRWRPRLTTVRARTSIAATVVVGAALTIGAISLVAVLRHSLVQNIDDAATVRASDLSSLARQGRLPATLAVAGEEDALVQVVDAAGDVVAASANLAGQDPISSLEPPGRAAVARTVEDLPIGDAEEFRIVALRATAPAGPVVIYVATSLEATDETLAIVRGIMSVGTPILVALMGVAAWVVTGRALSPVEAIRARVADISERALDRRVPVPPTGDEISRLAATMNDMLDRLEVSAERQRRFVADASHELQSPLAGARTDLEVALAHPDRADWPRTATDLLRANRRMEQLVRDLLFLARTDAGAPPPPATLVDLDDVVLGEVARSRAGGRVAIDTSGVSAACVVGRREDLARVVRNLLDNAEEHAAAGVTLTLTATDGTVTLTVADDGPGVAAGAQERIFERFARVDDARSRATGGTGLGLAIAREIVTAHGGTISLASGAATPAGATFVIRLPAG